MAFPQTCCSGHVHNDSTLQSWRLVTDWDSLLSPCPLHRKCLYAGALPFCCLVHLGSVSLVKEPTVFAPSSSPVLYSLLSADPIYLWALFIQQFHMLSWILTYTQFDRELFRISVSLALLLCEMGI